MDEIITTNSILYEAGCRSKNVSHTVLRITG